MVLTRNFFTSFFFLVVTLVSVSSYAVTRADMLKPLPSDVALGSKDAKVTMIEYHSVTCPHCAYFNANVVPRIIEKFVNTGKVLYIAREYPVDLQSFDATMIMRCINRDKVKAFTSILLSTQQEWLGKKNYMDTFRTYASLGGADLKNLDACVQSDKLRDQVFHEKLDAVKNLGVVNIPTFFVNGQRHEGARAWTYWESLLNEAVSDAEKMIDHASNKGQTVKKQESFGDAKRVADTGKKGDK